MKRADLVAHSPSSATIVCDDLDSPSGPALHTADQVKARLYGTTINGTLPGGKCPARPL